VDLSETTIGKWRRSRNAAENARKVLARAESVIAVASKVSELRSPS
jgi:hypothetical protein